MKVKSKRLTVLSAAILCSLAAPASWAADTVCQYVDSSGHFADATAANVGIYGAPDTTIAVASNFYGPALDLITDFLNSPGGTSYGLIGLCHNATGHLMGEILKDPTTHVNPTHTAITLHSGTVYSAHPTPASGAEALPLAIAYKYGLFAAANQDAPDDLVYETLNATPAPYYTIGSSHIYANGIPVIFTDSTSAPPNSLVTGTASTGTSDTIATTASGHTIVPAAGEVAVADPVPAPYGLAAQKILTDMGYTPWPPSIVHTPLFGNIDVTYQAVFDPAYPSINSGFVAKAQICNAGYSYVEFTNVAYNVAQYAVLLDTDGDSVTTGGNTAEQAALALWTFMNLSNPNAANANLGGGAGQTWNQWLTNHCYSVI
ncbi:hypothetical protein [Pollutimonas bauzanensis]|uniref:Molybdate transport system substrate-binding protein n=1 Tax=Pollutimonas bauzanensis TaxID=658167 RepID=A0A1M5RER9_9BURK|nr:hypothetical protein [Pollutimonas bauzanensis]SHH24847.1 molybdate transport system substrate-binding protein [Pollutimonas bauzanensis]